MHAILLITLLQATPLRVGTDTLEAANVIAGQPRRTGTLIRAVARSGDAYLITATFESAQGRTSYDTLAVDAKTLRPRWQRVHFSTDSANVRYEGNRVVGYSHQAGQSRKVINRILPAAAQPTSLIWHLTQSRPWAGSVVVSEYDMWADRVKSVTYRPLRKEKIRHFGKPVEVWVVLEDRGAGDLINGVRTARMIWIDAARKRIIMRRDRPINAAKNDGYLLLSR